MRTDTDKPRITTREELAALLAKPLPPRRASGLFARAPEAVCWLRPCRLDEVLRLSMGPAALGWRDGRLSWDAAAATRARLAATVAQDADGTPFDAALLEVLPAGAVDRLVYAADVAGGYRPPPALPAADGRGLAQCYARCSTWLGGLLPQQPDTALCVHAYDFATLAAAEAAATVSIAGTELRVEVLAWPLVIAAAVRVGEGYEAPPLLDAETARQLPFGAARAIVEAADVLSELGGPDPGVRFLDAAGPGLDSPVPVAAPADGAVSK